MNKKLMKMLVLLIIPYLVACESSIKPWVKPYERNNLAEPVMSWQLDAIEGGYMHHVYQAREGSRGAEGISGGGCGCN